MTFDEDTYNQMNAETERESFEENKAIDRAYQVETYYYPSQGLPY